VLAPPELVEPLLVILRWLHALATIVFLGWSAVLLVDGAPRNDSTVARQRFKEIVELSLIVFLATGAILTVDRLSRGAGGAYAVVLALKLVFGVLAYQFAFRWRRVGVPVGSLDGRLLLLFGAITVLLASVLKGVYDSGASR
jgi:hypothetical protein